MIVTIEGEEPVTFVLIRAAADKTKSDAHLWEAWEKLQAEVKAGNMTAEEAETKMIAIKKKAATEGH